MDIFCKIINGEIPTNKLYEDDNNKQYMRVIADHIRAIIMICSDGKDIYPSNKDRGYILRRLIRRLLIASYKLGLENI